MCAKSWGVEQQDIISLWGSNGEVASLFGSAVHKALEHYDTFKKLGSQISSARVVEENYAMPKHPILRSIIEEFTEVNKTVGDVVPEALVTNVDMGFCGQADRILVQNWKDKICRIQDYKVNIGSDESSSKNKVLEPFDNLPPTKISKYQLQMSFYANLLEMSGWTVAGLDVFVLEDTWKHYELDVLKVI